MGSGAIILAAGLSSRMAPVNKLLRSLGDRPIIRHVVQTALDAGLDPATVVVGPDREALHAALEGLPVRIVGNDGYEEGLASSIRAGVAAIAAEVDAAVFLLGDMPLIAPRHLGPLLAAFAPAKGRSICVPTYRNKRGDQGARVLFRELTDQIVEVEMPDDAVLVDIDTQADLDAAQTRFAEA